MNQGTARQAIYSYLDSNWSTTVICWHNVPFQEPESDPWIKATVKFAGGFKGSVVKTGKTQRFGNLWVNIFYPLNKEFSDYEDTLIPLFQHKSLSGGIQFETAEVLDVGKHAGKWYLVTLRFPFYYFE